MENNLFSGAHFGKPYKTRNEKKAIYQSGDDQFHHLFLPSCDIIVDNYGYLNCKEIPSGLDIISEWTIDEEKLDKLSFAYTIDFEECEVFHPDMKDLRDAFKAGFRAKEAMV